VAKSSETRVYAAGEFLYREGDPGDSLYLIRSGSVTQSRNIGGEDVVLAYVASGNYIGEMGLIGRDQERLESARAAVRTEAIVISRDSFLDLIEKDSTLKDKIQDKVEELMKRWAAWTSRKTEGSIISFFTEQGLLEGTDVLLIDESLCVGCDNCEKACAETHGGVTRLDREAGASFQSMHVPISCRHCEHPHCMKDCPPDAIHRAVDGEVYINDSCIGCGNCERNCPYGVIQLAYPHAEKPGLMSWLLLGAGPGPGQDRNFVPPSGAQKKAVKCDMCKDIPGGAACVRACPTGAALRVSPQEFGQVVGAE
jgi:Fe-S-cluster-containing hydrogenase component 2